MIQNAELLRILDANANRAREALRVLEDYARFALNDAGLTRELKQLRHDFAAALAALPMDAALATRDTPHDVGTTVKTDAELTRATLEHVLTANAKRLSESLRSLEECAKVVEPAAAVLLERLRYRGYAVEQSLMRRTQARSAEDRFRAVRLYVLLTESLCGGGVEQSTRGWETVLDEILAAAQSEPGGGGWGGGGTALGGQLREKSLPDAELLRRAKVVVQKCRAAGALAIINDRADIAVASGADGVHLGQTDLPSAEVRALLGPRAIIGVSTERIEQARAAIESGATYIAVGPMFPTTTKDKPRIVGPAYAAEVLTAAPPVERPVVAIGGIHADNVSQLTGVGIRTVAVSAAVLGAADPAQAVRLLLARLPPPIS